MTADANDLLLFARVIEAGSFSAAAERLGQPKSTVSRRIATLESQLGERLITRSTRRLTITDFGQSILEHAKRMLDEAEAASALAQFRQATPRGRLRVSLPPDFAERILGGDFLIDFAQRYPEVQLELDVSARRVDLLAENFDLAVRISPRLPDDASLIARRLADLPRGLFASPAYLNQHGRPAHPQQLHDNHVGLNLTTASGEPMPWRLSHSDEGQAETWQGSIGGPMRTNSMGLIYQLACNGLGIASFHAHTIQEAIKQGLLERVLPQWNEAPVSIWAVMPGRRLLPERTRVFVEALRHALLHTGADSQTRPDL